MSFNNIAVGITTLREAASCPPAKFCQVENRALVAENRLSEPSA